MDKMFKHASPELLDLLKQMLQFNPALRITAKQALDSKLFDDIRVPFFENPCPKVITHKIFDDGAFDYSGDDLHKYSVQDYKKMLRKEAKKLHRA